MKILYIFIISLTLLSCKKESLQQPSVPVVMKLTVIVRDSLLPVHLYGHIDRSNIFEENEGQFLHIDTIVRGSCELLLDMKLQRAVYLTLQVLSCDYNIKCLRVGFNDANRTECGFAERGNGCGVDRMDIENEYTYVGLNEK